jgi:hypothetical protein
MNEPSANPAFVFFLFILRCLIPIAVLLGISYLLRMLGLVAPSPESNDEYDEDDEDDDNSANGDEETEGGEAQ